MVKLAAVMAVVVVLVMLAALVMVRISGGGLFNGCSTGVTGDGEGCESSHHRVQFCHTFLCRGDLINCGCIFISWI